MEALARLDGQIVLWVQETMRAPWIDAFFTTLTNGRLFVLPLALLALVVLWRGGRRGRELVVALTAVILLTDQISSQLIKPLVARTRPCFAEPGVEALIRQVRSASFPSSHAANSFGVATLLALRFHRWAWPALLTALLISYSRIHVGVHYPSDVLAGAALGVLCGTVVWLAGRRIGWLGAPGSRDPILGHRRRGEGPRAGEKGRAAEERIR